MSIYPMKILELIGQADYPGEEREQYGPDICLQQR